MLLRVHPLFEFVPVESVVRARQDEYYAALQTCDRAGTSTGFIEFSLRAILEAPQDLTRSLTVSPRTIRDRLGLAREHFGTREFSRKEYRALQKTISSATASRDLRDAVVVKRLRRRGDKATAGTYSRAAEEITRCEAAVIARTRCPERGPGVSPPRLGHRRTSRGPGAIARRCQQRRHARGRRRRR
jgi:hypothetical protein